MLVLLTYLIVVGPTQFLLSRLEIDAKINIYLEKSVVGAIGIKPICGLFCLGTSEFCAKKFKFCVRDLQILRAIFANLKGLTKISQVFAFSAPFGKFSSILRRTPNSAQSG